jgi:hypothetical protein
MTQEWASSVKIIDAPCLSLDRLLELRAFVDSVLASQEGEEAPGEGGADGDASYVSATGFVRASAAADGARPGRGRTKLVDQLRALLTEAMATPEVVAGANDRWEAGDDEDHA